MFVYPIGDANRASVESVAVRFRSRRSRRSRRSTHAARARRRAAGAARIVSLRFSRVRAITDFVRSDGFSVAVPSPASPFPRLHRRCNARDIPPRRPRERARVAASIND